MAVGNISSLLTCLRRVNFRGMAAGSLSCRWIFIALHRVRLNIGQFCNLAFNEFRYYTF